MTRNSERLADNLASRVCVGRRTKRLDVLACHDDGCIQEQPCPEKQQRLFRGHERPNDGHLSSIARVSPAHKDYTIFDYIGQICGTSPTFEYIPVIWLNLGSIKPRNRSLSGGLQAHNLVYFLGRIFSF